MNARFPEVVRFTFGDWAVHHFEDVEIVMPPHSNQEYYWRALNEQLQRRGIIILESDIDPTMEQISDFKDYVRKNPDEVVVAPYLCYSGVSLTKMVAGYVVSQIEKQTSFDAIEAFTIIDKSKIYCDGIGFGFTYIPQFLWQIFMKWHAEAYRALHALDYDFSKWMHWKGLKARVLWECEPIHLHGKGDYDNLKNLREWACKLPHKGSITDLIKCCACGSIDVHYVPDLDQIVCKTCNQWMVGELGFEKNF